MAEHTGLISDSVTHNHERFADAKDRVGSRSVDLDLVGRRVRLSIAGDDLADALLGALRHRAVPAAETPPDLHVVAWDEATSGVAADLDGLPPAPEQDEARTMVTGDGFVLLQGRPAFAAQGYAGASRTGFLWLRDVDALLRWGERTKPLLEVLHSWLLDSPWQPVHAAAVAPPGGGPGLLLAGPSGAGKSSTALACVRAGWRYAGDDFVAIASGEDGPRVANLYCSARLKPDMAVALGTFAGAEVGVVHLNGVEKRDLLLDGILGEDVIGGFPIAAVLLPEVTGATSASLAPASAGAALVGIGTCTLHFLRAGAAVAFDKIGSFAGDVPAYRLELGGGPDGLPALLSSVLP